MVNIGVRAGEARGAAVPQILGNSDFWAAGENLGEVSFQDVSIFI